MTSSYSLGTPLGVAWTIPYACAHLIIVSERSPSPLVPSSHLPHEDTVLSEREDRDMGGEEASLRIVSIARRCYHPVGITPPAALTLADEPR